MSKTKRERPGPEARTFDRLKGTNVRIWTSAGELWSGKLVWVDVYTLGVVFDAEFPQRVSIVYKNVIRIDPV